MSNEDQTRDLCVGDRVWIDRNPGGYDSSEIRQPSRITGIERKSYGDAAWLQYEDDGTSTYVALKNLERVPAGYKPPTKPEEYSEWLSATAASYFATKQALEEKSRRVDEQSEVLRKLRHWFVQGYTSKKGPLYGEGAWAVDIIDEVLEGAALSGGEGEEG